MKKLVSLLLALALVLTCTFAMAESIADLAKAAETMTHEELVEKALAEEAPAGRWPTGNSLHRR